LNLQEKKKRLVNDQIEIESEIMQQVRILSITRYDSNTIKSQIDLLLKSWDELESELGKLCENEVKLDNGTR